MHSFLWWGKNVNLPFGQRNLESSKQGAMRSYFPCGKNDCDYHWGWTVENFFQQSELAGPDPDPWREEAKDQQRDLGGTAGSTRWQVRGTKEERTGKVSSGLCLEQMSFIHWDSKRICQWIKERIKDIRAAQHWWLIDWKHKEMSWSDPIIIKPIASCLCSKLKAHAEINITGRKINNLR